MASASTVESIHSRLSDTVAVVRFDGRLYFANTPHFTGAIHDLLLHRPQVRWVLIAGDGLNEIDASGVEALRELHRQLAEHRIDLVFFGLKGQVQNTLDRIGLSAEALAGVTIVAVSKDGDTQAVIATL